MNKNKTLGFTVIELAMVLVIVGLLVGGILIAKSIIGSSKNHELLKTLSGYDAAVNNFQTSYGGLPGDTSKFPGSGNDNSLIEDLNSSSTPGLGAEFSGEVSSFWVDLQTGGGLRQVGESVFTATVTGSLKNEGATINVPKANIGKGKVGIIVTNDTQGSAEATSARARGLNGVYLIGGIDTITDSDLSITPSNISDVLTTVEALAVDSKIDDGNPDSGLVIAYSKSGGCISSGEYALTEVEEKCSVGIGFQRLNKSINTSASSGSSGGATCGDGGCTGGETFAACPSDCGPFCGDGDCSSGYEDCSNCSLDCGACFTTCGDGTCGGAEDCSNCSLDCGSCSWCGDGSCNGSEGCSDVMNPGDPNACEVDCGNC